jgi:hypothetical protein
MADERGELQAEYLKRVMLRSVDLTAPKDVAWYLASYARDARLRIQHRPFAEFAAVRDALEEALGLKFEGKKGEHFFCSTLIQTLFYGIFSAWALWARTVSPTDAKSKFDWVKHTRRLNIPILRKLFHELAEPGQLETLNLTEALGWTEAVLNRVDRVAFFEGFEEHHAVQYFCEPFLQAYDPELRKQLGGLVHTTGNRSLHGRASKYGAARRARSGRRSGGQKCFRAGSVLWHCQLLSAQYVASGAMFGLHRVHVCR